MINVPDVEIEQNNNILNVNQGIAWQWMLNDSDIPGATDSELTVTAEGNYSVLIEFESGCSLLTNAITIGNYITDFINENNITISPNPARESIQIIINLNDKELSKIQSWEIITTNADVLIKSYENIQAITKIDVSELSPAVYYLRIISEQQIIIKKLVIQ
jgi:CHAT domain-containing protein